MTTKNKQDCPGCETESYTRNHYFTGKLMVERDFTDEQRYFREKIRIHHQRLHGSGVVCGLTLEAHDESCDDRYVILQPGSAVDCCGRDILVTQPEVIDLYAFPQMQELIAAAEADDEDASAHRLQLCIKYRECPTEDIPVLYDECGCDDSQCAPNRILESYDIDLLINAELDDAPLHQPGLDWESTLNLAHAEQVYLHEASNRLYVATADDDGIIYQVSTDNHAVEASQALERRVLAITGNAAGDELYVVVAADGGMAAGDAELWVYDTSGTNLAASPLRQAVITDTTDSPASALTLDDGRLLALFHSSGRLHLWDAGLAAPMDPSNSLNHGVDLAGLSSGSSANQVYSTQPDSATVHCFDVDEANFAPHPIDSALDATIDRASRAYAVKTSAPDQLLVLDADNNNLRLVDPSGGGSVSGTVALAHSPRAAAISSGANWAHVLVVDGDDSYVQSVNLHLLRAGESVLASTPVAVGNASQDIVITGSGSELYLPYIDDLVVDNAGGVALLEVSEANCQDLLWQQVCPDCDSGDCLVLATVENYRPGFRLADMPTPAPDALADLADSIARIDNRTGRVILPSTQAIATALQCLMENCCGAGGGGEQGPPGLPGTPGADGSNGTNGVNGTNGTDGDDGRSISEVDVTMVPCGEPASGSGSVRGVDSLRLELEIPGNCDPELAHLCNISWLHGHDYGPDEILKLVHTESDEQVLRFLIRFDKPVEARDLNPNTIRVRVNEYRSPLFQLLGLYPVIRPGRFSTPPCELEGFTRIDIPDDGIIPAGVMVDGAEIRLSMHWIATMKTGFHLRFSIHGDLIRDEKGRGADLNHLPQWLTNADPSAPTAERTGDGVPGGQFVSYFNFTRERIKVGDPVVASAEFVGKAEIAEAYADPGATNILVMEMLRPDTVAINHAGRDELIALKGIGPELADAIIAARDAQLIRDEAALLKISGIGNSLVARLRAHISFGEGE